MLMFIIVQSIIPEYRLSITMFHLQFVLCLHGLAGFMVKVSSEPLQILFGICIHQQRDTLQFPLQISIFIVKELQVKYCIAKKYFLIPKFRLVQENAFFLL